MPNSTHNEDNLLRYLDGELSGAEKQELEKELQANPALSDELTGLQLAKEAVKQYGLKEQVAAVHTEMMKELKQDTTTPVRKISSFRKMIRYSVAAAASIIIIFLGIQAWNFYQLSPEKLYQENYTSYSSTTRAAGEPSSETETLFANKKYAELIDWVKRNMEPASSQGVSQEDILLSGIAALELKRTAEAVKSFETIVNVPAGPGVSAALNEDAEYYLALAYLRNKDYDQAIELMSRIRNTEGHTYQKSFSSSLIRKVKMLKWR